MQPTNPNFNPDQNPFESILSGIGSGQQAGGGQQMGQDMMALLGQGGGATPPQGAPQPGGQQIPPGLQMAGAQPMLPESQLEAGKNPSATKSLVQAIGAIQNFIAQSTSRDDIMIGRNIVKLLTRLVNSSEDTQLKNLEQGY